MKITITHPTTEMKLEASFDVPTCLAGQKSYDSHSRMQLIYHANPEHYYQEGAIILEDNYEFDSHGYWTARTEVFVMHEATKFPVSEFLVEREYEHTPRDVRAVMDRVDSNKIEFQFKLEDVNQFLTDCYYCLCRTEIELAELLIEFQYR